MSTTIAIPHFLIRPLRTPLLAIAIPVGLGAVSGYPTGSVVQGGWFKSLYAPPGRPPNATFKFVWPALYAAMGYASHLAVKTHDGSISPAIRRLAYSGITLYYAQLALNLAWTPLFFGARKVGWALVDIVGLTGTTIAMTMDLHDATGGATTWFLAPYCAWLGYATYLNAGYFWLNRGRKGLDKIE